MWPCVLCDIDTGRVTFDGREVGVSNETTDSVSDGPAERSRHETPRLHQRYVSGLCSCLLIYLFTRYIENTLIRSSLKEKYSLIYIRYNLQGGPKSARYRWKCCDALWCPFNILYSSALDLDMLDIGELSTTVVQTCTSCACRIVKVDRVDRQATRSTTGPGLVGM